MITPEGLIVTIADCRAAGLCARGCRDWFTAHGLDWSDFLANGATPEQLRATGSSLCEIAIAKAEARHG